MKQNILSPRAGGFRALEKTILLCLLLVALGRSLATPACGAVVTLLHWDGGTSWSAPLNWMERVAPTGGEDLVFFGGDLFDPDPMENNLHNLTVRSMLFNITAIAGLDSTLRLSGHTLGIKDYIQVFSATDGRVFISCGLRLEGNARFFIEQAPGHNPDLELHLDGPIDLNGHNLEVIVGGGTSVEISGAISGNGNVVLSVAYGGVLGISGSEGNTFRGTAIVRSTGTVGIPPRVLLRKQSGAAVPERLVLEEGSIVTLGRSDQIADHATVEIRNGADFQLNGFNETIGTLVLNNVPTDANATILDTGEATLTLLDGLTSWNESSALAPTPIVKGRLALPNAGEDFNIGGSAYAGLDIQAQIVGAGGFSKSGSAALLLQGANTFGGSVAVHEGILDVRNNNALGSTAGGVTLSGNGSLTLRNATIAGETLFVRGTKALTIDTSGSLLYTIGTCLWSGPIELNTNLLVWADNTFLVGPISGVGGLEFLNGVALIGGPAANTFTGRTLVRSERLELYKSPNNTRAFSGPLVVGGGAGGPYEARWLGGYQAVGATLTIHDNGLVNLNNFNEDFGPVTLNGGRVETGAGQFTIYQPLTVNPASASAVINGFLGLPSGVARVFNVGDGAPDCDLIVNAVVFGNAPQLIKRGPGTLCLHGVNTYFATTLVEEGILDVSNGSSLGSPADTRVFNNATLRFSGSGTMAENFQIVGAGVGGSNGVLEVPTGGSFTLTGSILMDAASTINVAQSAGLGMNGVISGPGPLTKIGSGNLILGGVDHNTYTGDTLVNQGTLFLDKSTAVTAIPGNLVVGTGNLGSSATSRNLHSYQIIGNITVNRGGLLDVNGLTENVVILSLNGGGSVQTVSGTLILNTGGAINVNPGSVGSSTISGRIALDPGNHSFVVGSRNVGLGGPECTVSAVISETSRTAASLEKSGSGTLQLMGANTYRGVTTINGGRLRVDGVQPQSAVLVNAGTRLEGGGTVGRINFTGGTGIIAPGNGLGILTCSNFNVGLFDDGVLQIALNGTTPGSGHDQLNVHGLVKLTGITLNASLGFASAVGQQFVIINNDGSDLVGDNFNGLPQGASLYIGDEEFTISYTGGTGNDVVLTRIPTPPRPVLVIEKAPPSSVRLRWPTNAVGFTLQSNTNLNMANWTAALPLPAIAGTNNVVVNPASGHQTFYRLFKP